MKSRYKTFFKFGYKECNFEIRKNKSEYIFMYCKKSIADFERKAKRIKNKSFIALTKTMLKMFLRIENYNGRKLF